MDILKYVGAAGAAMGIVGALQAATVYQASPGGDFAYYTASEYGDEIVLGGSDRFLTEFSFDYYSNYAATGGLVFSVYAQDGPMVGGVAAPGTLLFQTTIDVVDTTVNPGMQYSRVTLGLDGSLNLPDRITYTVAFGDVGAGNNAGLRADAVVDLGSSGNDFWLRTGPGADDWAISNFGPGADANFVASVTAVPEPQTVALMLLGMGGLAFALRRRR